MHYGRETISSELRLLQHFSAFRRTDRGLQLNTSTGSTGPCKHEVRNAISWLCRETVPDDAATIRFFLPEEQRPPLLSKAQESLRKASARTPASPGLQKGHHSFTKDPEKTRRMAR